MSVSSAKKSPAAKRAAAEAAGRRLRTPPGSAVEVGDRKAVSAGGGSSSEEARASQERRFSDGKSTFSAIVGVSRAVLGGLVSAVGGQVRARVPEADLDDRDPDYIRDNLPALWLLASFYFRARVRGLERVPRTGPVLLVGNHSGGNVTPDTIVFTLAFSAYFGAERCFYQLAHNLVLVTRNVKDYAGTGSDVLNPWEQ